MTRVTMELTAAPRQLIDDRLDAIDRVLLLAGVPRGERGGVVEEVERHIFDTLAKQNVDEPTRRDVLSVLASLDPPEAYAPEGYRDRVHSQIAVEPPRPREPQPSWMAVWSAIAGIVLAGAGLILLALVLSVGEADWLELLLYCVAVALLPVMVCGIVSGVKIRRSRGWLYGLPFAATAVALFPVVTLNIVLFLFWELGQEVFEIAAVVIAVLSLNVACACGAWKLTSVGCRPPAVPH